MIPISDENPIHRFPFVTVGLIVACIWIFVVVQPNDQVNPILGDEPTGQPQRGELEFTVDYAAIPCEITRNRSLTETEFVEVFEDVTATTCSGNSTGESAEPQKNIYFAIAYSMFLHGGWLHLLGNMLFLWVFGNNIEDRLGHLRYLGFYLLAGLVATLGHVFAQPSSALPIIGASGAIAGVMGAYLVLYPRTRVGAWMFIWVFPMPVALFLVLWFVGQFQFNPNSGVAWVAHVAGFVFGAVAGVWLRGRRASPPRRIARRGSPPPEFPKWLQSPRH